MRSNQLSNTSSSKTYKKKRSLSPRDSTNNDLREIADRLNDIIHRSNQIDQQLSRIEELRSRSPKSSRNSPTQENLYQKDFLSPISTSQTQSPSQYYNDSGRSLSARISPTQRYERNKKKYVVSPEIQQETESFRPSLTPNATPKYKSNYSTPIQQTSTVQGTVTLDQIFEAICQLRQEVAEIASTQAEMKLEISRLKRNQK